VRFFLVLEVVNINIVLSVTSSSAPQVIWPQEKKTIPKLLGMVDEPNVARTTFFSGTGEPHGCNSTLAVIPLMLHIIIGKNLSTIKSSPYFVDTNILL
jgi:hypothetical protein